MPGVPMAWLPARLRIEQSDSLVVLRDSAGTALQEITIAQDGDGPSPASSGARRLRGRLKGGRVEVSRPSLMGGRITESYALKNGGELLEIRFKLTSGEDAPSREFVRAYRRARTR